MARNIFNPPKSLDDWIEMFKDIYWHRHYEAPIEKIGFHFMEEIGECQKALLRLKGGGIAKKADEELEQLREYLRNELADVFSWICTLVIKLDRILKSARKVVSAEHKPLLLSEILWEEYSSKDGERLVCHRCKREVCNYKMGIGCGKIAD